MAKWFRSEPMEYISIILNEDAAHDCLADLGKIGVIQFTDVSPGYNSSMNNGILFDCMHEFISSHPTLSLIIFSLFAIRDVDFNLT
jgi:hypothetical protein